MHHITRRNVIAAGVATGTLLLSGVRPASAKPMTWEQFKTYLAGFVTSNHDRIIGACYSRGGWEKWLQTELAIWILGQDDTCDLSREQLVYGTKETVDFVFNGPNTDSKNSQVDKRTILMELKCQSLRGIGDPLKKMMDDDKAKLGRVDTKFQLAQRYVVGAALEEENNKTMTSAYQRLFDPVRITRSKSANETKSGFSVLSLYFAQV